VIGLHSSCRAAVNGEVCNRSTCTCDHTMEQLRSAGYGPTPVEAPTFAINMPPALVHWWQTAPEQHKALSHAQAISTHQLALAAVVHGRHGVSAIASSRTDLELPTASTMGNPCDAVLIPQPATSRLPPPPPLPPVPLVQRPLGPYADSSIAERPWLGMADQVAGDQVVGSQANSFARMGANSAAKPWHGVGIINNGGSAGGGVGTQLDFSIRMLLSVVPGRCVKHAGSPVVCPQ
jgi:hypothetical protein